MPTTRGLEQSTDDIAARPAATLSEEFLTRATLSPTEALILRGQERGYVTNTEVDAVLPADETPVEQLEDAMTVLSVLGIDVIENEDAGEPTRTGEINAAERSKAKRQMYRPGRHFHHTAHILSVTLELQNRANSAVGGFRPSTGSSCGPSPAVCKQNSIYQKTRGNEEALQTIALVIARPINKWRSF